MKVEPLPRKLIGPRVRHYLSRRGNRDIPVQAVVEHISRETGRIVSRQAVEYHVGLLVRGRRVRRKGPILRWIPARG